jgi:hypothetical protein
MTKAQEIKNILEGFKLGKLGAGGKKLAPEYMEDLYPIEAKKVFKDGVYVQDRDSSGKFVTVGFKWNELDGRYKFYMRILAVSQLGKYKIIVFGGKNMNISFSRPPKDSALEYEFVANNEFREFDHWREPLRVLTGFVDHMQNGFSFGYELSKGSFGSAWTIPVGAANFGKYMSDVSVVEKSSHFKITASE